MGAFFDYKEATMFVQLDSIITDETPSITLKLSRGANGTLKVCVMPATSSMNPTLAQPLALAATAVELDAGFADLITTYKTNRLSLTAQVAATAAILGEATKKAADKAVKGLKSKTAQPAAQAEGAAGDDEQSDTLDTSALAADVPVPAAAKSDQADLLSLME